MRGRLTEFTHRGLSPLQFTPMSGAHKAHALDGGIPCQSHIGRHRPAASDEHHSADTNSALGEPGVRGFISKPYRPRELASAVRAALDLRAMRAERAATEPASVTRLSQVPPVGVRPAALAVASSPVTASHGGA